jgi:hypothetical protein
MTLTLGVGSSCAATEAADGHLRWRELLTERVLGEADRFSKVALSRLADAYPKAY